MLVLWLFYLIVVLPLILVFNYYGFGLASSLFKTGNFVVVMSALLVFWVVAGVDIIVLSIVKRALSVMMGHRDTYTSSPKDEE